MNDNDTRIVRITNIFDFDFTGELGARFGGRDFAIPAGKSLLTPFSVGDHLATHLARQAILRGSPIRDDKERDGKGTDRPLWDEQRINEVKARILSDAYTEEKPTQQTESERMAAKVEQLNNTFKEPETPQVAEPEPAVVAPASFKDKAEVITELERRGITFNVRSSKATLEKLLSDTP